MINIISCKMTPFQEDFKTYWNTYVLWMRNEVKHSLFLLFFFRSFLSSFSSFLCPPFFSSLSSFFYTSSFYSFLSFFNYGYFTSSISLFFFYYLVIILFFFEKFRLNLSESFLYNKLQEFTINYWNSYTYSPFFLLCRLQFIFVY